MEHRPLGQLSVSVVGLGCNNFGRRIGADESAAVVHAALGAGIDYFDTADVYGAGESESFLGRALAGRRDEAVVATKFGAPGSAPEGLSGGHPDWVRRACDASLKRLGTGHIDHYQLHFPDADVPIEETLGALQELVTAGKVREIGCSNFGSGRLHEAAERASEHGLTPFRSVQNRYSLLHRDPEPKVVPACRELGLGLIPYFPLESGLLSGKVRGGAPLPEGTRLAAMPEDQRARFLAGDAVARADALRGLAEAHGRTLLELAISWLAGAPAVLSVIAGASRPEQAGANAAAAGWALPDGLRAEIDALTKDG